MRGSAINLDVKALRNANLRSFVVFTFNGVLLRQSSKVDKLDWTRSTRGRDNKCLQSLVNRRTYGDVASVKLWIVM